MGATEWITDVHTHIVPGVDDGARDLEEALEMLRCSLREGIGTVFATPHSSAFDWAPRRTREAFAALKQAAAAAELPIRIFPGCEILICPETVEDCLRKLREGIYPAMGGSARVLIEFDPWGTSREDAVFCVRRVLDAGWQPIVAHVERYRFTTVEAARTLRELGALLQINAYSIAQEREQWIRDRVHGLLAGELADLMGTDSHRMDHRSPKAAAGVEAFVRQYGAEYARRVCVRNPEALLIRNI